VIVSTADWVVIAVIAIAGLYGISTGFLRGAFSLAGFAFGAYLGARLAPLILSDGSPYVPVVALGGAVLCGMLMRGAAALLAGALRTSIGVIPGMRFLDRVAGLLLGLVAGVFLCWAIGAVLLYLPGETDLRRSVQRSVILSEINDVVPPERFLEELERVDPIGVFLGPPAIRTVSKGSLLARSLSRLRRYSTSTAMQVPTSSKLHRFSSGFPPAEKTTTLMKCPHTSPLSRLLR
jgi:uncharacterized membrane protein required for colicin V production